MISSVHFRLRRRRARKAPPDDADIVFKAFMRVLQRLREAPRGAAPAAPFAATREKA